MPEETFTRSAILLNVGLFSRHRCIAKETYVYMKKGPTKEFSVRDMCSAKETYSYEKRLTKRNLYMYYKGPIKESLTHKQSDV